MELPWLEPSEVDQCTGVCDDDKTGFTWGPTRCYILRRLELHVEMASFSEVTGKLRLAASEGVTNLQGYDVGFYLPKPISPYTYSSTFHHIH